MPVSIKFDPLHAPAQHCEMQLTVPCGGADCEWAKLATRASRGKELRCRYYNPGQTHVACVAFCADPGYGVRVTLDRRFDSDHEREFYRTATLPVSVADAERVAQFIVRTIQWSHKHTNDAFNRLCAETEKREAARPGFYERVPDALLMTYVPRVDDEYSKLFDMEYDESLNRWCGSECLTMLCTAFASLDWRMHTTYNYQGYFCNATCPCLCASTLSRGEIVDDSSDGPPTYFKPPTRSMICSEFVATALLLTEYSVYFPQDPGLLTPLVIMDTLLGLHDVVRSLPLTAAPA